MQVTLVEDEVGLAGLLPEWRNLAGDVPFHDFHWAESWWRNYRHPRAKLFVLVVRNEQGALVAVAPWYLSDLPGEGRVVRFLGSGEVCSDYQTIHCRSGQEAPAARRLANWLAVEEADQWDLVELCSVQQTDPVIETFAEQLTDWGHKVYRRESLACWRTRLPSDWEQFLASLSKSRRERIRQLLRRNFDSGRAVLHHVRTRGELDRGYAVLVDLHQKRRQVLGQTGCFASERFNNFHRAVAAQMLERGRLRLLWTEIEGRPAAAEYSLVGGDTVYYYQGGFEPELAHERPGWLSFAASLRLAIDEGYRNFDFLRGDESYKSSWAAEPRAQQELRVVGRHTAARVRHAAWQTREAVKRWARQSLALGDTLSTGVRRATGWSSGMQHTSVEGG